MTAMLSRLFLLACLLASPAALGQTYAPLHSGYQRCGSRT